MRVLIAFDKFKDALTAKEACAIAAAALGEKYPAWELDLCPLADGGEGLTDTLVQAGGGHIMEQQVTGPRGAPTLAKMGLVRCSGIVPSARTKLFEALGPIHEDQEIAIVEMASASGLALLPVEERDPWQTTTSGTGDLLRAAAERNVAAILLGVGGSATSDLGFGALQALGLTFHDASGEIVPVACPARWSAIRRIAGRVELPPVLILCDVTNPLLGPEGAVATFGPQKGLRAEDALRLETQTASMAVLLCQAFGQPVSKVTSAGAGAAGGLSFGLMVAAEAKLTSGFDLVANWLDLPARIQAADLIITGEGRFDQTSFSGKGPGSLVLCAQKSAKPVHVFAGSVGTLADPSYHAITPPRMPLAEALNRAPELLRSAVLSAL